MTALYTWFRQHLRDERGSGETLAAIATFPILIAFIIGAVNIGMMFSTRLQVLSIAQDTVQRVASEGGDHNERATSLPADQSWSDVAMSRLWDSNRGRCKISGCISGQKPSVECTPGAAEASGDPVSCHIVYPYRPISANLFSGGVYKKSGFGSYFTKPFDITITGRAETGMEG